MLACGRSDVYSDDVSVLSFLQSFLYEGFGSYRAFVVDRVPVLLRGVGDVDGRF